jgi:hypothetical protein
MRNYALVLLCVVLAILCLPIIVDAAGTKLPPGSFLTKPASNPVELSDLVGKDKTVAVRYAKHYGMTPAALAAYFRTNFKVSKLQKPGSYTVYYATKSNRIIEKKKWLRAGTVIYVDPYGGPAMIANCGNPLGKSLPRPVAKVKPEVKPVVKAPEPVAESISVEPLVEATEPVPPEPIQVAVLAEPAIEIMPLPTVVSSITPAVSSSSKSFIPGLLGVGAVGAAVSGGGGSSHKIVVVPEPSSMLMLGAGGASILLYRLPRRRNRRK